MKTNGDDCAQCNKDNLPSTSSQKKPDNNANLTATDESKGAIPKTILTKMNIVKKTNNNIADLPNIRTDFVKRNGYRTPTPRNCTNRMYNDSDSDDNEPAITTTTTAISREISKKTNIDFQPLNIPIENELLSPLLPLNHMNNGQNYLHLDQNSTINSSHDSSSDDNELLSISDDGCIYTYKGDNVADLPSSFFNLEIPPLDDNVGDNRDVNSSPEMDFLEMDFDPGPSGDADSDSISNIEIENAANLPLDPISETINDGEIEQDEPLIKPNKEPIACCSKYEPSNLITTTIITTNEQIKQTVLPRNEIKMPWSCNLSERTRSSKHLRNIKRHHKGELLSPNEIYLNGDISITNYHNLLTNNKIYIDDKQQSIENFDEKIMVWTEKEACLKQITQIGPSACGATAVLNVLNALRLPVPTVERVQECIQTRLRANTSPLKEYLLSRSIAGCNHRDIIKALYKLSDQRIYARFFSMYPERIINLQKWLSYWLKNGAIPIATLNLQKCDNNNIPDSWHHQMIFGIGPKGIYMVNPLECIDPSQLWPQLTSESILLIKTDDVLNRWNQKTDLKQLNTIVDVRWRRLNVVGQIARIVRESRRRYPRSDHVNISHIKIPADYSAGITLAIDKNSSAFNLLRQCPELPLLNPEDAASAL